MCANPSLVLSVRSLCAAHAPPPPRPFDPATAGAGEHSPDKAPADGGQGPAGAGGGEGRDDGGDGAWGNGRLSGVWWGEGGEGGGYPLVDEEYLQVVDVIQARPCPDAVASPSPRLLSHPPRLTSTSLSQSYS
jgi:hypothetical protein